MDAQILTMNRVFQRTANKSIVIDFDQLYRATRADVYAYVYGTLTDQARAEDVVSTVFEKAFKHQRKYQAQKGSPKSWLFGIARNAVLDDLRKKPLLPLGDDLSVDDPSHLLDQNLDLQKAMQKLTAGERELLALKFWAGFNNREIAKLTGLSESNVGTRLARILTTLREEYND